MTSSSDSLGCQGSIDCLQPKNLPLQANVVASLLTFKNLRVKNSFEDAMPFNKVSLDREATEVIDGEATYQLLEWSPHHRACGLCQWPMTVWSLMIFFL